MPLNNFSIGRDVSLDIITPQGPVKFSLITKFKSKMDITDKKIKGLDGMTRHLRFPDGWSGEFEIDRQDSTADDYFSQIEANYYAGLNEQPGTLTETITEPNGNVTQYRYVNVLLKYDDAGEWLGDSEVKQRVSFVAAQRIKVA
ncbi:MAG: hypothetical protein KGL17_07970 [Betaproteobacteria bacterium]|nr:hypothetical protein [Betaproteobacteria bacterium]